MLRLWRMAWFRRTATAEVADAMPPLPPLSRAGMTTEFAARARAESRPGEHGSLTQVFSYLELLRDRYDVPLFYGAAGRPAILLGVSDRLRTSLDGLRERIDRSGAKLYLQGHGFRRFGLIRAVLELPEYDLIFEAPLSIADGDVQEFLTAAHHNESIELHLAHAIDATTLAFEFQADGIRPVINAALTALHGLDHPAEALEIDSAANDMEARFPSVSAGLTRKTRVQLIPSGAPGTVVRLAASH